MTSINSQEDFLQALRDNPAWREAVRVQILGEELIQLPARFNAFVDQMTVFVEQMTTFVEDQKAFNQRMITFVEDQKAFNQRMITFVEDQKAFNQRMITFVEDQKAFNHAQETFNTNATARFNRMESDIGDIKGTMAQDKVIAEAMIITDDLDLQYVRNLTLADLVGIARKAAAGQPLSNELRRFRRADLVIEASDKGQTTYLAVEISYTGAPEDLARATYNAEILRQQTNCPAFAVIASIRNTNEVEAAIDQNQVIWHQVIPNQTFLIAQATC
jgi:hypothetical protein